MKHRQCFEVEMSEEIEADANKIDAWFKQGRFLLREGKITAAHTVFTQISQINKIYPNIGHALAVSIPNSFLIKLIGKFDKNNVVQTYEVIKERVLKYNGIRLLIIDVEGFKALPHYAISLLKKLDDKPNLNVKLLQLSPKPKQILKNLNRENLIWTGTRKSNISWPFPTGWTWRISRKSI